MSTIFKTRISQQEVQTPTVSATAVVADNFITSSIQSESVASENINATTVQGEEIIANDLSTENIAISNDLSIGQDVIVPSGNVLVGRKGIVSFVDDGEEVDENGASGFPIYNGVPEILNNSTVYNIGEIDKDIDLSNIRFGGNDNMVQTCEIWLSTAAETARSVGDTYEITWPENVVWLDSTDGNAPAIVKGTEYRIVLRKENEQIVASIAYAIGEGQQNVDEMIRDAAQKDGDNTFTGANTFTGEIDMSGAQVQTPEGWDVAPLSAESIQAVAPIAWSDSKVPPRLTSNLNLAIGNNAEAGLEANAIGTSSKAESCGNAIGHMAWAGGNSVALGHYSRSQPMHCIAVGYRANTNSDKKPTTVTIGSEFTETTSSGNVPHTCQTQGTGSITIGAGANTLNNGDTESSNSVTIGCKASNTGADSVVIGASAKGKTASIAIGAAANGAGGIAIGADSVAVGTSIAIGKSSQITGNLYSVAVGDSSTVLGQFSTVVGHGATASAPNAVVLGARAKANKRASIAIGADAQVSDLGATVIRSTAEDGTYTQLYFSGANTPLANTYTNGEALMGFVTVDNDGNPVASGYKRLSAIFDEGSMTQPATLDENGEWVMPKVFHPSDLDLPVEEPSEPEDVEITIPDSVMSEIEEYIPLPVYPIVEPEIEEI